MAKTIRRSTRKKKQAQKNKWLDFFQTVFLIHAYRQLSPSTQKLLHRIILIFVVLCFFLVSETGKDLQNYASQAIHDTSLELGFKTDKILIEGRNITDEENLLTLLSPYKGLSTFTLPLKQIREDIETKIPWIERVIVQRKLPDTLHITLIEVTPLARWQHDNKNYVIAREKTIAVKSLAPFESYPLLLGKGANIHATDLFEDLINYPDILSEIEKIERIENRRWDLISKTGVTIMLPAQENENALQKLHDSIKQDDILNKRIAKLDLRFSDRIIVKPTKKP